jgi:hypothetical protein
MKISHTLFMLALVCLLLLPFNSDAQERRPVLMSFNAYPYLSDVSTDADLTVNTTIPLPGRFSYFSFINFSGLLHSGNLNFSLTEQNIIWQIAAQSPLDFVAQDTIRKGADNDTIHLGIRWRLNNTPMLQSFFRSINLNYSFIVFPVRFDQRNVGGWQLSHAFQMSFPAISDRLYVGGFIDHNINESTITGGRRDNIVSETQLGFRIYKDVYAVAEYRINEYRRSAKSNVGAGLEIKTSW